jgi:hypothetical protein
MRVDLETHVNIVTLACPLPWPGAVLFITAPRRRQTLGGPTMKKLLAALFSVAILAATGGTSTCNAQSQFSASYQSGGGQIDISYFYNDLAPDGDWFNDPNYGWCWTPYDVAGDWRPYRDGHWEYTDYGWSWVSEERWGWAPYHYGRWFFDPRYGWAWVPGNEWAPAWVAWRSGDGYVGWAPLPPAARWQHSGGLQYAEASRIPSQQWCFVPQNHVFDVSLHLQMSSVARNVTLMERSRDATRFQERSGRPVNLGPDVTQIERSMGHRVPRAQVVDADRADQGNGRSAGNGRVGYYRPTVNGTSRERTPAPEIVNRRNAVSDAVVQNQRDQQHRRLESDLNSGRAQLQREQADESRRASQGAQAEEVRRRHAAEQQAFDAHAAQQRQVLDQRMQKRVVKPNAPASQNPPGNSSKDHGNGKDKGNGKGKGGP